MFSYIYFLAFWIHEVSERIFYAFQLIFNFIFFIMHLQLSQERLFILFSDA